MMTEHVTTPTAAERAAALRARASRRPPTAQIGRIVSAGLASTAVLGLTAAFGWSARATTPAPAAPEPVALPGVADLEQAATSTAATSPVPEPAPLAVAAPQPVAPAPPPIAVAVPAPPTPTLPVAAHASSSASH